MLEELATIARPVLDMPFIRQVRRNHGLEHATVSILSSRIRGLRMSGRSSASGFVLFGDVPTEMVETAVHDALARMRGGEHNLAVHPNCGTNLVTTGLMTSLVAMLGFAGAKRRDSFNRLPIVMVGMMAAVLYSQPLGMNLQKYFTTDGNPADLEILSVTRNEMHTPLSSGPVVVHNVSTRSS
jgi:uncharacterized protein DUF6391